MTKIEPITPYITMVKRNANFIRHRLDDVIPPQYTNVHERYIQHLDYCNYHPTTGLLAWHNNIELPYKYNPKNFKENLSQINKSPQIIHLKNIVNEKIDSLYPKTKKIRKYIIEDNRLSFDNVTRAKGYKILDKLKILLKR